jgi:8-oxo-dGTP pyrophosphatase MutT (NUDIX family)
VGDNTKTIMTEKIHTWKVKESKEIANCRVFKVREDLSINNETGKEHSFFIIENPSWVNVFAITKDNQVVVIEQFRHGTGDITIEIPGGLVDGDEDAKFAAMRELVEETGYTSSNVISLGKTRPNPAIQDNWLYHFLALDCEKTHDVEFDETESVLTKTIDLEEFIDLIKIEKITHSAVLTAFLKYQIYKQNI